MARDRRESSVHQRTSKQTPLRTTLEDMYNNKQSVPRTRPQTAFSNHDASSFHPGSYSRVKDR
jgi:hypothetical protein